MSVYPNRSMNHEIDAFLTRIFPDEELRTWVQGVFADMLVPVDHRHSCHIYIWYGTGGNGKTALYKLLKGACGSHIAEVDKEILTTGGYLKTKYYEQAANRNMLMVLDGSDAQISLNNVKKLFDLQPEPNMKSLYIDPRVPELRAPCGDIHIICNTLPRFDPGQFADKSFPNKILLSMIKRRIFVIPFNEKITGGFVDPVNPVWFPYMWQRLVQTYADKLMFDMTTSGVQTVYPKAVEDATAMLYYPGQKSSFERFCDEHVLINEEANTTRMNDIMKAYHDWLETQPSPGRRVRREEAYDVLIERFPLVTEGGVIKNLIVV